MKRVKVFIFSIISIFAIASCTQTPDSHNAETSSAAEVDTISANATRYSIDTSASQVNWYGFKPAGQHNGTIGIDQGSVAVENGEIVGGSFTIDLNDISVEDLEGEDNQKLTGHLKSEDFFHIEEYPTAKFEITDVKKYSGNTTISSVEESSNKTVVVNDKEVTKYATENPTHLVTGNLTLRDTTLSIAFPASITVNDSQVEAEAKFNIDRTKWNVSYNDEGDLKRVAQDKFIYNTVNVGFDIVAKK